MPTIFSKLPHDLIFRIIREGEEHNAREAHKKKFQATVDILNNLPKNDVIDWEAGECRLLPLDYLGWFDLPGKIGEYRCFRGTWSCPEFWILPKLLVEFPELQQDFQDYIELW